MVEGSGVHVSSILIWGWAWGHILIAEDQQNPADCMLKFEILYCWKRWFDPIKLIQCCIHFPQLRGEFRQHGDSSLSGGDVETPKASRGRGMGRGYPLLQPTRGSGGASVKTKRSATALVCQPCWDSYWCTVIVAPTTCKSDSVVFRRPGCGRVS